MKLKAPITCSSSSYRKIWLTTVKTYTQYNNMQTRNYCLNQQRIGLAHLCLAIANGEDGLGLGVIALRVSVPHASRKSAGTEI